MTIIKKGSGSYITLENKINLGDLIIDEEKIVFNKKNIMIIPLFGMLGNAIAKGKTILEIKLSDIKSISKTKFRLNKNVLAVELKNETICRFAVSKCEQWIALLNGLVNNKGE